MFIYNYKLPYIQTSFIDISILFGDFIYIYIHCHGWVRVPRWGIEWNRGRVARYSLSYRSQYRPYVTFYPRIGTFIGIKVFHNIKSIPWRYRGETILVILWFFDIEARRYRCDRYRDDIDHFEIFQDRHDIFIWISSRLDLVQP